MDLEKKDRVMLINQYSILKRIDPDNQSHYDELIEVLTGGYKVFYSLIDQWTADDMEETEGRLVLDILTLYRAVGDHLLKNPDSDLSDHPWAKFPGFDGNNEGEYLSFTQFLIRTQGKFTEQRPKKDGVDDFDSHMPCLPQYRKMLAVWRELGEPRALDAEQVRRILGG